MRVISQEGFLDAPYDKCVFFAALNRANNTADISFYNDYQLIEIAHYSSLKKAKDVLEDMRISYASGKDFFMLPKEGIVQNET